MWIKSKMSWNQKSPKEEHGYVKTIFRNFSSTLYFEKTKKTKILFEGSLNLSFKDVLRLKQKTTLFPDSDIYIYIYIYIYTPDINYRTL